jgi:OOP family OmpA-OmpF porin
MRWLAFLLWIFLGIIYFMIWSCNKQECCAPIVAKNDQIQVTPKVIESNFILSPINFNWSSDSSFLGPDYNKYVDSLKLIATNGQKLEIVGLYSNQEVNTSTFANLGLARAEQVKQRLSSVISPDLMITKAKLVEYLNIPDKPIVSHQIELAAKQIEEIGNKAIIYHSYNSTNWDKDEELISFLTKLASKLKAEKGRVEVVGHTDNIGETKSNEALGMRRAVIIKKYLISQGVSANQINVSSLGESVPKESNDSEEGRSKNRRTEIEYFK